MSKLKPDIEIAKRGGICYVVASSGRLVRFKPWLGDSLAFLYDFSMGRFVFPRQLGADIEKHYDILARELATVHGRQILELGTGSGSAVHFLASDNTYTGTDVSPGLLRLAAKRFVGAGFASPEFYLVSGADLPFEGGTFDLCLCILSLNFIGHVEKVFEEVNRVLRTGGMLVCSVPVPERNRLQSTINGVLHSEAELTRMCEVQGLGYERIAGENGALLYFRANRRQ